MMTLEKYNELVKKAAEYEGKVEIRRIDPGTYDYMIVTRKSWGLFINDKFINNYRTKTAAEENIGIVLHSLELI